MFDQGLIKLRQDWCLRHPCESLEDCKKPGYVMTEDLGMAQITTTLSLDLFGDHPQWEAQVIRSFNRQPIPLYGQAPTDLRVMASIGSKLVQGVGLALSQRMRTDQWAITYSRLATPEELNQALVFAEVNRRAQAEVAQIAIGEVGEYDFTNKQTRVGDGLHIPVKRKVFYDRNIDTGN